MNTTRSDDARTPEGRTTSRLHPSRAAMLGLLALLAAGCDEGHTHSAVVAGYASDDCATCDYAMEPARTYAIAVQALTSYGAAIAGADVRLIVSTAPEQVAYGQTGLDGVARFVFAAYPGVPVTADVSAHGWGSDYVTAYTDGYNEALVVQVVL